MRKILLLCLLAVGLLSAQQQAPDFSLPTLTGKTVKLADYKGKIVVLNFWASWCPPCRLEIPDFVKVYQTYKGKGVEFIGIAVSSEKKDIQKIVEQDNVSYPVVIGTEEVKSLYGGIQAVPTTFFINRKGEIVKKHVGKMSEEQLVVMIKELLSK